MTTAEIISVIVALISALLTGGFGIALLTFKASNDKLRKEAKKIEVDGKVSMFDAAIKASDTLSENYEFRLKILTETCIIKDKRIQTLEEENRLLREENFNLKHSALPA